VWGKKLTFSDVEDVYFLTGLPFCRMALPAEPHLPRDVWFIDLAWDYCLGLNPMSGSVVGIEVMDTLLHQCIVAMIVRIYGSLATQWISIG
jgi:hypothetical protein